MEQKNRIFPELQNKLFDALMDANFTGCETVINECFNDCVGENTRRMINVGRIQDFLMDNNFFPDLENSWELHLEEGMIVVGFDFESVGVSDFDNKTVDFDTSSETLYEDVIAKVKELINF